jgi:hypothetical protein
MRTNALVLAMAAVASLGCGSSGDSGGGGGGDPTATTGTLLFENASVAPVSYLYVSPTTASSWGSAQNGSPIVSGGSLTLSSIPPNTYDAMAVVVGTYSTYFAYAWGWALAAEQTYYLTAYSSSFSGSLKVINGNASYSITGVYLTPTSSPTWGSNQIAASIPYGGSFDLQDIPAGSYDLKCVHSNAAYSTGTYSISSLSQGSVTCY